MKFLRDFYIGLSPLDRAVMWIAIGLALAFGFAASAVTARSRAIGSERFTAPPFDMQVAESARR